MDPESIQKLAAEVVRQIPNYSLWLLTVQVVLIVLAAAAGTFLGEYFKTRGKNFATKADFDTLLDQLRANTQLVETIKVEVGQRDWAKREWTTLQRKKLEELMAKVHDCVEYSDRFRQLGLSDERPTERDPLPELVQILSLYFPELIGSANPFVRALTKLGHSLLDFNRESASFDEMDTATRRKAKADYTTKWELEYRQMLDAKHEFEKAAAQLLREIMGVAEGAAC